MYCDKTAKARKVAQFLHGNFDDEIPMDLIWNMEMLTEYGLNAVHGRASVIKRYNGYLLSENSIL